MNMDTDLKESTTNTLTTWAMDPAHSEITFKARHMMISNVKGEFKDFEAEIFSEGNDFSMAKATARIDVKSIDTRIEQRNNHLKSADFFDADRYDTITFESTAIKKIDDDEFILKGILTIKGIAKEVKLNVDFGGVIRDPYGNERAGFTFSGKISRKEWGLVYNPLLETGGAVVGDEIKIGGDLEFIKKTEDEVMMPTA